LLCQIPEQSHSEMNREEREEVEYNKQAGSRAHNEGYPYREGHREEDPPAMYYEERNLRRAPVGDTINLDRKVVELEKRCGKDKGKAAAVKRLLMGPNTPFTQPVAEYQLLEKFKAPQI
jgi:hypothetical protein